MRIHVKTGSFTFVSAIGFDTACLYMKNNSQLKGQFKRLKNKQKVRLKMAIRSIHNCRELLSLRFRLEKAVEMFPISSHNFNSVKISWRTVENLHQHVQAVMFL
jgi:phosphatidate phosphatase PAH1